MDFYPQEPAQLQGLMNQYCQNPPPNSPRGDQCKSAQDAIDAAKASANSAMGWLAVAGVCAAACAASFIPGASVSQAWCLTANLGGTIFDMATSKNLASEFATDLGALAGGALGGVGINQMAAARGAGAEGAPNKDYGACLQAATAVGQYFMKNQGAGSSFSSAVTDAQGAATSLSTTSPSIAKTAATNVLQAGGTGITPGTQTATAASGSGVAAVAPTACTGTLQCAVAADSHLPPGVGSPAFADAFQKAAGIPINSLTASSGGAVPTAAAAMSGGIPPSKASDLVNRLQKYQDDLFSVAPTGYSGGGGSGAGGGSGGSDDMGSMMASMMAQLMPGAGKDKDGPNGPREIDFNKKNLTSTGGIDPDRTVSLFERVSFRYSVIHYNFIREGAVSK